MGVRFSLRALALKQTVCVGCESVFIPKRNTFRKYCSNQCQQDTQYKKNIKDWKAGILPGWSGKARILRGWLREYLLQKYNFTCVKCPWNKRHPIDGLPLVEINHIDGNAENCLESNLEVLCPCCHSETPNFRRRNPTSTRDRK